MLYKSTKCRDFITIKRTQNIKESSKNIIIDIPKAHHNSH